MAVILLKKPYEQFPAGSALRVRGGVAANLIFKGLADSRADLEEDATVTIIDYDPDVKAGAPENKALAGPESNKGGAEAEPSRKRRKWLSR